MFGRDTIIPFDLIYPNGLEFTRESINENQTVQRSEIGPATINPISKFRQIDILKDAPPDEIEPKCPAPVKQYIEEKRERFQVSYAPLKHHRMLKMSRAQRNYNRRIKRTSYEIGDLVLVCHPMLKKGLSKGLAPRYYGPFEVIGKYENGCDYLIKNPNRPKAKVKIIHLNNLKTFFERGQPKLSDKPSPAQKSNTSTEDDAHIQPNVK